MTNSSLFRNDSAESIQADIAAVNNISVVPSLLKIICQTTGMGFAAVARVTAGTWTACAVHDNIDFGLKAGGQLALETTLCNESRLALRPVTFDHASEDPVYKNHHTPRIYNLQSYISVPIVLPGGEYFGNLCAVDPQPRSVSNSETVEVFERFAELISMQLANEKRREDVESQLMDAKATTELREHFIAVLGHDLRNPLSSVVMTAEILSRRTAEPDLVKLGQRLRTTTQRMSRLIDDVLDFARGRLGAGIGVSLEEVVDLAPQLHHVVTELQHAHPEREIVRHIAASLPVQCDLGRMQQLLSNLLGNAIAHGDVTRPIFVDAQIAGKVFEISVANSGEPIPAELHGKVFEPYWRPVSSKPGGGLGLGLYICAQIVKAHGGGLEVRSSAENGTRFTARIPVLNPATS